MQESIEGGEPFGTTPSGLIDTVILAEPQPEDLLAERWSALDLGERLDLFQSMNRANASDFFRQSNSGVGLQSYCKPCKQQVKAARCTLCHLCIHPSACYGFRVFACLGFSLGRPAARGACLF